MKHWWMKCAVDITTNPKIVAVGPEGLAVFLTVLGLAAPRDGRTNEIEARPRVIAARCMGFTEARVAELIDECVAVGLLERDERGRLGIIGWDDDWKPEKTETQARQERRVAKKRRANPADGGGPGDDRTMSGHGPDNVRRMSGVEERRGEESTEGSLQRCASAEKSEGVSESGEHPPSQNQISGTAVRTRRARGSATGCAIDDALAAVAPPGGSCDPPDASEVRRLGQQAGERLRATSRVSGGAA